MKHPAAPLLAAHLGRLQHTNKRGEINYIFIPGFRTSGMTDDQATEYAGAAGQAISEGVIETLETLGYDVIAKADIETRARELAAEMAAEQAAERVVHCNRCRAPLYKMHLNRETLKIDATTVAAVQAHFDTCR